MFKELLYQYRNKEYGAYILKDLINKNLFIGYFVSLVLFIFLLIAYFFYLTHSSPRKTNEKIVEYESFVTRLALRGFE